MGQGVVPAESLEAVLAPYEPRVRGLAMSLRILVSEVIPDAIEELDRSAALLGFTFLPGTFKGLIVAIAPSGRG